MTDENTQPGEAQKEYNTIGGLGNSMFGQMKALEHEPEATEPDVNIMPEDTPVEQETPPETSQPQEPQAEVIPFKMPDGTESTVELPVDPVERQKVIASLASGKEAYLLNREIVKEKNPELASQMYDLMQKQTEILGTMSEQQKTQHKADPLDVLTDDQARYYKHLTANGDDEGAEAYFKSQYATNMMIYEQQQKLEQMGQSQQQMAQTNILDRNVAKLRQLDPTLPSGQDAQAFTTALNSNFGEFLHNIGMSNQEILLGNADFDYLHKIYEAAQSPAQEPTTTGATTPAATAPVVSPEVLRTMQDVSGGSSSSAQGANPDGSRYKNANQRDLRQMDKQDGSLSDAFLAITGIDKLIKPRG